MKCILAFMANENSGKFHGPEYDFKPVRRTLNHVTVVCFTNLHEGPPWTPPIDTPLLPLCK